MCIKMCCTCGVCRHVLHLRKFKEPPSCLVQTQVSPQCRAGLASPLPGRQPNGGRNGHAPPNIPVNMHQALLLKRQASPRWILLRGSFAMLFCPSTLWAAYLPRMWRHCHSGLIAAAFLTSAISPSTRHRLGSKKMLHGKYQRLLSSRPSKLRSTWPKFQCQMTRVIAPWP